MVAIATNPDTGQRITTRARNVITGAQIIGLSRVNAAIDRSDRGVSPRRSDKQVSVIVPEHNEDNEDVNTLSAGEEETTRGAD